MKGVVYDMEGKEVGEIELGMAFSTPIRPDIIARAVIAERANARQPYGTDPLAGKRTSAHYHGLRRYRWTMMNREMARMARIHHQGWLDWTARFVPQAVKGRPAHPPKVEKVLTKKINKKEALFALLSAAAASANSEAVAARHIIDGVRLPIIVTDDIEKATTADIIALLKKLGLSKELQRCKRKKVRAGRGKSRGRAKTKKGPLLIVAQDRGIGKIKALDVVTINKLSVCQLAPGAMPGRLCIWSRSAVEKLKELAKKYEK